MKTFKKINLKWLLVIAVLVLFSCKKEISNSGTVANPKVNIYVAGTEINGANPTAVYWKNGIKVNLTDGSKSAEANSIMVSGNSVYVAGDEGGVAKYWENGNEVTLAYASGYPDPMQPSANSIAVLGNDVYVTGQQNIVAAYESGTHAFYWKNGTIINLPEGTVPAASSIANSVYVSGNDVYITGGITVNSIGIQAIPVYWKNNELVELGINQREGEADAITVSGSDVYVAGLDDNGAEYWKNGNLVSLPGDPSYLTSISVLANTVYVAGWDAFSGGMFQPLVQYGEYWKNGAVVNLTNPGDSIQSTAYSIFASGNDVYIAGAKGYLPGTIDGDSRDSRAVYWKNGVATMLSNVSSSANSIFIANQ